MTGETYRYDVTRVEDCKCQAATLKSFIQSSIHNPNEPCKNTAKLKVSGITLCPVHVGTLITYGRVPAATGGVWEDDRRG